MHNGRRLPFTEMDESKIRSLYEEEGKGVNYWNTVIGQNKTLNMFGKNTINYGKAPFVQLLTRFGYFAENNLIIKYDSRCKAKKLQAMIDNALIFFRMIWNKKSLWIDNTLRNIDVVPMKENIKAWSDRNYRYVNVPDYMLNGCYMVRTSLRLNNIG